MTLSLLLLRRLSHLRCRPPKSNQPFSSISSSSLQTKPNPNPDPNTSSLSARMNFVFDQIDAIEQQRSHQKDDTLQRIRAWRDSKKNKPPDNISAGEVEVVPTEAISQPQRNGGSSLDGKVMVEVVHPWQEWVELMEMLARQNYFDHRRRDEDKLVRDLGFDNIREGIALEEEGFDFSRDFKTVQTACLNFGRDRFDILRSLSRQDIQVLVGYGCPSTERKVVFSSKLLRKLVHLDEGDVCSSCSLRSSCERGYLITNKEDEAMTFDIMRVLLTYGFDPVNGSVVNETLLKKKSIKTVVRKLLHEVVKLGALPIDPNLPPPVIKKPPPKVKQTPPPPKKRVGRDDIEMKRGDWLCPKCDFMNFAKNTVCLQCDAKRPKRQLLPGEWECPECKFLNYRRNMACFHCDCKRPPDEFTEIQMEDKQRGPRMRSQKVPSRTEVSDAWNLDFDDNESDGADVAAFEYADSRRLDEEFSHDRQGGEENSRRAEGDYFHNSRPARPQERDYSARGPNNPGTGFDDFDDEEDDIESYELDSHSGNEGKKSSSIPFSDLDVNSDSEDTETASDNWNNSLRVDSPRNSKSSKPFHRKTAFSGSKADELDFDSDEELPVHRNWGSTHVAESRQRNRGRGRIDYGSDEDPGLSSEPEDDFPSRRNKGNGRGSTKGRGDNYKGESSDFESDDEGGRFSSGGSRGILAGPDRRRNTSKGRGGFSSTEDSEPRARSMTGDRNKPFKGKFDRSPRGYRGDNRGFQAGDYDGRRKNSREGDSDSFRSPGRDNFGNKPYGRKAREGDSDSFRSPRRDNFGNNPHGRNAREGDSDSFRSPRRDNFGNKPHGRNAREGDSDSFRSPGRDNFGNKPHGRNAREGDSDSFRSPRRDSFDTKQHKRYNNLGGSSTRDSYLDEERYTRPRVNVR